LIGFTAKKGLSGLEHFAGIPSTVGGGLWQNLHFLSPDRTKTVYIEEFLRESEIVTEEGERKIVDTTYFSFGYDTSILHTKKDVVLSATFELTPKAEAEIENVIDANLKWREEKHPQNASHCSAGSIFKKIENLGAGRLIEQVGLKGYTIGGAQISDKHANFIINTGNGTARDVVELIELVKQKVRDQFNVEMQAEISMIGEF
jgi:UDP-N-acetylmuramate dehydrogenase